jgi:hypothetical protein
MIKYIRWFLSGCLLVGIYTETGIFTTLFALLVIIQSELVAMVIKEALNSFQNNSKKHEDTL